MTSIAPVRFEDGRPMLLGGLRRRHSFSSDGAALADQWREWLRRGALPGRVGTNRYGVMCGADATGFEYMCAVEVESFALLPEDTGRMRIAAQRYAVFAHPGSASSLRSTWQQVFAWLASGPFESAHVPDFEVYAGRDPFAAEDGIEIWAGVRPRRD